MLKKLLALLRREVLEHRNLWRVPLILIGIAVLIRLSWAFGNLSVDLNVPSDLQLDSAINSMVDGFVARALNSMNYVIMIAMFVVAIFYTLSSLYNERQDQSVLFWRSLPISDTLTIASKLIIGLIVIPLTIVVCQAIVSAIFLDTQAMQYLSTYYGQSLLGLTKVVLWSMLPTIAWCLLCSEIAKRNPFLLAFMAPLLVILVDKLFFKGTISDTLVINRVMGMDDYTLLAFISGLVFSAACISVAVIKRSERL